MKISMIWGLVLAVLVLLSVGCQRNTFDTADASGVKNAPAYTTKPNLNGGTAPVDQNAAK